nr:hypothetical protein GCM10020092_038400 [Actinoplanes digitatis]
MVPQKGPVQAGEPLAGQALPTNQWWTSALTGPLEQPIWGRPLAIKNTGAGLGVSAAAPVASPKAVITPFQPALSAGGAISTVRVVGYGAFHVVLRAELRGGGTMEITMVQGSPLLYLDFGDATPSLTASAPITRTGATGPLAQLTIAGQRWDVLAQDGAGWQQKGDTLSVDRSGKGAIVVARVPDGADNAQWTAALTGAAGDPVIRTTSHMTHDGVTGTVTQSLRAERQSGQPAVWALLPHQQAGLVPGGGLEPMAERVRRLPRHAHRGPGRQRPDPGTDAGPDHRAAGGAALRRRPRRRPGRPGPGPGGQARRGERRQLLRPEGAGPPGDHRRGGQGRRRAAATGGGPAPAAHGTRRLADLRRPR